MEARSALDRVFLVAYLSHLGSISLYSVLFFIPFVFLHTTRKHPQTALLSDLWAFSLELLGGFEPPTSSLPRTRSAD